MGVPATTGQLRTKLSDMEIGDYISYRYFTGSPINAISISTIGDLGETPGIEAPLTGISTTNQSGWAYFIKVDKGLLISDRVIHNSLSWDVMNTAKAIQGGNLNSGNIIPPMTSNTSPSGAASASYSNETAWKAFDKLYAVADNSVWQSDAVTDANNPWLCYDFGQPTRVGMYSLVYGSSNVNAAPKSWTFEGWSDADNKWIILDSQSEQTTWAVATPKQYKLPAEVAYSKYRIKIKSTVLAASPARIAEMGMYETPIIRSLTGGVSYIDVNGNSTLTDVGLGAWPPNNEWDKYIKNSHLNHKVTPDDDAVWHHKGIFSWTQDTSINGSWKSIAGSSLVSTASCRVVRGYDSRADNKNISFSLSNNALNYIGFRPVLEYKEV